MRATVLPRDLQPGDKIDRMNKDFEVVQATVKEVKKTRTSYKTTVYKVSLVEYDLLTSTEKSSGNRHLVPFILQPTRKITVEREA